MGVVESGSVAMKACGHPQVDEDRAWQAVLERDRRFNGLFVTGVLSTGIYCRPSCSARHPQRRNVRFFANVSEAESAGLRACLRCRPGMISRDEKAVKQGLEYLKTADGVVPLAVLAEHVGYSPTHFQRLFTRMVGMSPAAFARRERVERAAQAMQQGASVTEAIYAAGFGASSRFYEASEGRMGMAPSVWRKGGAGAVIHWAVVDTTLGPMLVAASDKGVCRLSFGEGRDALVQRFPHATLVEGGEEFNALLGDVLSAVEQPGHGGAIALDVQGTAFQEAVWRELQKIPPGQTRSYAQLAAAVGKPLAVRAAGSANGANHVSVLIPCHRVVRSDGGLGGYAYGVDIKRELLRRENAGGELPLCIASGDQTKE